MIAAVVLSLQATMTPVSEGAYLWFALQPDEQGSVARLCAVHHDGEALTYTAIRGLASVPVSIAAHGNAVWVLPDSGEEDVALQSMSASWNDRLAVWETKPESGLDRLPLLKGFGVVDAVVGTPSGPYVVGVASESGLRLTARLEKGSWSHLESISQPGQLFLAVSEDGAIAGLSRMGNQGPAHLTIRLGGTESEESIQLPDGLIRGLVDYKGTWVAAVERSKGIWVIGYLQDGGFTEWGVVDDLGPAASLLTGSSGSSIFQVRAGTPMVRQLDWLAGKAGQWQEIERRGAMEPLMWSVLVSLGLVLVVVVMVFGSRWSNASSVPDNVVLAPLGRRMLALTMDLLPGVGMAMGVMGAGVGMMLDAAISGPLPTTLPLLGLAGGGTALWCALWELVTGQTPGKWLLHLRVRSLHGDRLSWWQIVVRNVFKGLTVIVPPLGVFVLLSPMAQSPGDIAAGTIVLQQG